MFGQVISPTKPYTKSFVALTDTVPGFVRHSNQQKAPTLSEIVHEFDVYWKDKDFTKKEADISPLNDGQITGKIIYKKMEP